MQNFIYKGTDINAVLDRLPTAKAKEQEDYSYLVMAEVYGHRRFDLWLRGQGENAEVK